MARCGLKMASGQRWTASRQCRQLWRWS